METLRKPDGEGGWQMLEQIMEMSKAELVAYAQMKMDDPNAWWKNTVVEGEEGDEGVGEGDAVVDGDDEGDEEEVDVAGPEDDGEGA